MTFMRTIFRLAFFALVASTTPSLTAQDTTAEPAESGAREILADPRLQNLIRSAKNDPEAMVEELQNNPEDAVREATQIFQENRDKIDTSSIDTPENRKKAEALSAAAMTRANEMVKEKPAVEAPAKPEKVPATRSVTTTTQVATPVAMPVEGEDTPIANHTAETPVVQSEHINTLSNSQPTKPQIPVTPHLTENDVPAPQPLTPKYNTKKATTSPSPGGDHMEIMARESIMDSKNGILTFRGEVFVDHPDYDLKCEKLEIQLTESIGAPGAGSSAAPAIKRAIATGGMVEIKRIGEDGKIQVALARKADYDALKQEFILSGGPPYIQDGDNLVRTTSQDSQIIMRGNGTHEIIGSGAGSEGGRQKFKFAVPKSNGSDSGIGAGLGSGLDLQGR